MSSAERIVSCDAITQSRNHAKSAYDGQLSRRTAVCTEARARRKGRSLHKGKRDSKRGRATKRARGTHACRRQRKLCACVQKVCSASAAHLERGLVLGERELARLHEHQPRLAVAAEAPPHQQNLGQQHLRSRDRAMRRCSRQSRAKQRCARARQSRARDASAHANTRACAESHGRVETRVRVHACMTHLGGANLLCGASIAALGRQRTRRHEASDVGGGAARVGNHEHRLREK